MSKHSKRYRIQIDMNDPSKEPVDLAKLGEPAFTLDLINAIADDQEQRRQRNAERFHLDPETPPPGDFIHLEVPLPPMPSWMSGFLPGMTLAEKREQVETEITNQVVDRFLLTDAGQALLRYEVSTARRVVQRYLRGKYLHRHKHRSPKRGNPHRASRHAF